MKLASRKEGPAMSSSVQITEGVYRVTYRYGKSFTVSKRPHGYVPGTRRRMPFETVAMFPLRHQDALKVFLLGWLPDSSVGEDLYTGIIRKALDLHTLHAALLAGNAV